MSRTVAIVTLGCKTNQFESAAIAEQLGQAGFSQVAFEQGADLVIVNTCTVTAATDAQSRNLIRRARRVNPQARVVVTGCYAQVDPEAMAELPGVALVIGNEEKRDFLNHLVRLDDRCAPVLVSDIRESGTNPELTLASFEQRSRAFVQIQNGCDAFCAYCIIPYARGRSRSANPEEVVSQIVRLGESGYPEVVLTGIHIGNYGLDLSPQLSLLELLQRIEQSAFTGRLRLGSIEPTELTQGLLDYCSAADWICPHWHIPLQAGDDQVLARMNRSYSTAFFADLMGRIRQQPAAAAIGLDIITGFPGETQVQFEQTLQFLEHLPFTHLHVFPFSRRPGTPADKMPEQLPGDVIKRRASRLRELGAKKLSDYCQRSIGEMLDVVIEGGGEERRCKGLTANYLPVYLPENDLPAGTRLLVQVQASNHDSLIGIPA